MENYKIVSMTRDEAFLAMRMGSKVTHWSFTSDEYLHNPFEYMIMTEDGYSFNQEFWSLENIKFQNGWEIYKK